MLTTYGMFAKTRKYTVFLFRSKTYNLCLGKINLMNWRILLGLVLLLVGMAELYTVIANRAAIKPGNTSVYAGLGCAVWMAVGVFFIIKGAGNKGN